MKDILVGYTGFVGGNISAKHMFEGLYNSKNINEAWGAEPELLVYSGVRAEMFLANKFPEQDKASMDEALNNILKINPKILVLISTISVHDDTAYGRHRLYLENEVRKSFPDCLIIRLPALYGKGIKKNFIYDMIHYIPAMLNESKYRDLSEKDEFIASSYSLQDNGFYKCTLSSESERAMLRTSFEKVGFSALNFTDSRSEYQFYNLSYLWSHIVTAIEHGIKLFEPVAEPVSVAELSAYVLGKELKNEIREDYPRQHLTCPIANLFGGKDGYVFDKQFIMQDIKHFVEEEQQ